MSSEKTIYIATRGSALALAQSNFILAECRKLFPDRVFDLKIIKTTGDKLQTVSMARIDATLPRGLFTKELEEALLKNEADLAVHSLKDLPTILPDGLKLGAVTQREDVRDVLIYRGPEHLSGISDLPKCAVIGTSSTRRAAQLLEIRPELQISAIRGNVGTRLHKLADTAEFDAIILAAAGLKRLKFQIASDGTFSGPDAPQGIKATVIALDQMLPCVGQAAIGIEIRSNDALLNEICAKLNHTDTWNAIEAERAFLRALGGGCQSAVAAYAEVAGDEIRLRGVSFLSKQVQRSDSRIPLPQAVEAAENLARQFLSVQ